MTISPWAATQSDQGHSVAESARKLVIDSAMPIISTGSTDDLADHMWGVLVGFAGLCLLSMSATPAEQAAAIKASIDEAFAAAMDIETEARK